MRNIITIASTDLRVFFSDTGNLIGVFLMPVILAFALGVAFGGGGGSDTVLIDVIDNDNSAESTQFLNDLRAANPTFRLCPMDNDDDNLCDVDEDEANPLTVERLQERVDENTVSAGIVIPSGFGESRRSFEPMSIDYYSEADLTTGDPVRSTLDTVIGRLNGAVIASQIGESLVGALDVDVNESFTNAVFEDAEQVWQNPPTNVQYTLTQQGEETEVGTGFSQSVPGMATMFVMFNVLTGMGLLIREKKRWTLQRLVTMPVSRAELIGGKVLGRFTTGLLTFVLMIVVGILIGVDFGDDPLALAIIAVTYTLCVTAMTFAISPLVKTENQANSLSNLIGLIFAAIGGAWWPLEIVPDFMRIIGHISPVAWAMDGFNELIFFGGGTLDVLPYALVLLAIGAVLFVIGVIGFSYE